MNNFLPYVLRSQLAIRLAVGLIGLAAAALLIITVAPDLAQASVIVAEDDFEEHTSGSTGSGWADEWELEANARFRHSGAPFDGSTHLRLRNEDASAVRGVDTTGESSLRLQLWVKRSDFDENSGVLEVSEDGSTYVQLQEWNTDSDYSFFDFDLSQSGLTFSNQFWVRFRILGDERSDGTLYIDELVLLNSEDDPDPPPPSSGIPVLIDGQFPDWPGKANLTDLLGDQSGSSRNDIAAFYWANNIDEEINFHMLERYTTDGQPFDGSNAQNFPVRYIVYIDTNNNGNYSESGDRRAVVTYVPINNSSFVNVKIYPGDSFHKIANSGWNDWGDSRSEGGLRVEFPLDWNDLDIQFGGVIRMYAVSFNGFSFSPQVKDRVPDGNADIQWSPASVLGPWLLGAASVVGIAVIWFISRRRRLWT